MTRRILTYLAMMAGMFAFSALFVVIFANSIEVSCARDAGQAPNCRITKALLGRMPLSSRDVLGITDIQLEESCDDGCAYRAVLITSGGGGVPLNDVYTDEGPVLRQIDVISAFLAGTGTSLEYEQPVQWWVVALVLGLDLMGAAIVAWIYLRQSAGG